MGAIEKPLAGIIGDIHAYHDDLRRIRQDIHAHPETAFDEHRTSDVVAAKLTEWGYEVHRGIAKTGVVGVLKNGMSTKKIGLRADMDALHIHEKNAFAHKSQNEGKMHACGHDGHTTMLLGGARHLAKSRNFDGTLHVIFQPAEENEGGARVMIEEGLFDRFPCDTVWGMHNWPEMSAGHFAVMPGPMMAGFDIFEITLTGRGAHAAMPHNGTDPVPVACQLVQAFQTIITRNKRPIDAGVISVTMIHTGEATNVVPDSCEIQGTVRTFTLEVLDLIETRMKAITEHTCAAFDTTCEFVFKRNYPPTINHPAETEFVRKVMTGMVGAANVHEFEPTMGAEDFSYFLLEKPGCYFLIGNGDGSHRDGGHGMGPCMLHNPSYDFNDELIPLGASLWVHLAEQWLAAAPR